MIHGHSQLYFIVIDSNNNVFGHYHPGFVGHFNVEGYDGDHDDGIFLFTLNSNGRCGVKKYDNNFIYSRRSRGW